MSTVKILIAEKDPAAAQDLQKRLEKLGYEVIGIAQSREETLEQSAALTPGLIIMNTHLRAENEGIHTGSLICASSDIPIVYLSSRVEEDTVRRASSTGPFGYIVKPFDETQLFVTIEVARVRHKLEQQLRENKQWLNGVLMSIGDGVIAVDSSGLVRFINARAEKLTGLNEMQAIGKPLPQVFRLMDERSGEFIDLSRYFSLNQTADETEDSLEAVFVSPAGRNTPLEVNFNPLLDSQNAFQGLVLAFRDITTRRQAMEQITRQASRAEALVQIAKQINSRLDLQDTLDTVCRLTNQAVKASASVVFLYDSKSGAYRDLARKFESDIPAAHTNPLRLSFSRADLLRFLPADFSVFTISDPARNRGVPFRSLLRLSGIHHLAVAPLVRNNEVVGALICGTGKKREFTQEDLLLLHGLAEHVMIAVANMRLFEQVRLGRERQRLLSKNIVEIQEAERRRIARELHDHLGQSLTGLQFMLETVKQQADETQKSRVQDIQNAVTEIIGHVREMSLNLRPSMLDDLGLIPTLKWHIERFTAQTGIRVHFDASTTPERFPANLETTAYRIIQEALTNVARHSNAREAFVRVTAADDVLRLEIIDNGKGFDASTVLNKPTSGLSGMSERADLAGGYLTVNSSPNQGTHIVAELPLTNKTLERRKNDRNHPSG